MGLVDEPSGDGVVNERPDWLGTQNAPGVKAKSDLRLYLECTIDIAHQSATAETNRLLALAQGNGFPDANNSQVASVVNQVRQKLGVVAHRGRQRSKVGGKPTGDAGNNYEPTVPEIDSRVMGELLVELLKESAALRTTFDGLAGEVSEGLKRIFRLFSALAKEVEAEGQRARLIRQMPASQEARLLAMEEQLRAYEAAFGPLVRVLIKKGVITEAQVPGSVVLLNDTALRGEDGHEGREE